MSPLVIVDRDARSVTTLLPDRGAVTAVPRYDTESFARAASLGYGDGRDAVWRMTEAHDRLHTLIALTLGRRCSSALLIAATGQRDDVLAAEADAEERLVLLIARLLNEGVEPCERDAGITVRVREQASGNAPG